MNKLIHHYIAVFSLLASLALASVPVFGQRPDNSIDTNFFLAVDAANYDSLLHNFYMQQYVQSANSHRNRKASQAYAEFDNIPDSVFIHRLQRLHMVVPMTYNSDVRAYIKLYVRIMSRRLDAMLSLTEYYFPMFEETLDRYKVPAELKYLTIVESALNPQATSRAGAAGLWQFMYSTGRHYDLEVNSLVDERRDPYKSTVAAARLLRSLYDIYRDWQLAMAAYNCGPGNVNKAIARSGGKHTFWEIYPYLPRETRGYIPAYIGATYVMNYYQEHGLTAGRYELPLRTDTIHLHKDVHFAAVTKFTGIPTVQLRQLNPQYRADVVPASSRSYAICLPSNRSGLFLKYEDSIYRVSKDTIAKKNTYVASSVSSGTIVYHKVRKGETWSGIANRYGVSVNSLKRWNGKGRKSSLKVGTRLKIYLPAKEDNNKSSSESETSKNDTVSTAADSSQVANNTSKPTANTTKADNNKSNTGTKTTTKTTTKTNTAKNNSPVYYTVRKGDSLGKIASKHHTSVTKLKQLNNLRSDKIRVGQRLRVK